MREITTNVHLKRYVGNEPLLVVTDEGEIKVRKLKRRTRAETTICPADATLIVGTEAEIAAEAAIQDARYAPIKAAKEAAATK